MGDGAATIAALGGADASFPGRAPRSEPHAPGARRPVLLGRDDEIDVLTRLLEDVRRGTGRALLISGEPGVGRTALLDHLAESATGCTVIRVAGVEAEAPLPLAALHRLCAPWLDHLDALPDPQRAALSTAFGRDDGTPPAPFVLGLAVLGLLSAVASPQPVVCVLDDVHLFDDASAQVLGIVARRLTAEPVAVVAARRDDGGPHPVEGIPQLALGGLAVEDARRLLDTVVPEPLDPQVRDLIVAEARGNPSAIVALGRRERRQDLAGGYGLATQRATEDGIELVDWRLALLSPEQRRVALLAAADPVGDPGLLWRAAARAGIAPEAVDPSSLDRVLRWGPRLTFHHPTLRQEVYRSATAAERRAAHRALAEATDPVTDPDRRAWHLARAATGPDEDAARALEESVEQARARGGLPAAAAFLERAAALSGGRAPRAARGLAAAAARERSGDAGGARRLLETVDVEGLDERQRVELHLLRARTTVAGERRDEASRLLLLAAAELEAVDAGLARDALLDALTAAHLAGRHAPEGLLAAARAVRLARPAGEVPTPGDELLRAWSTWVVDGPEAGTALLRRAVTRVLHHGPPSDGDLRWDLAAGRLAAALWDLEAWRTLTTRTVDSARRVGALGVLAEALPALIAQHTLLGEADAAALRADELVAVAGATDVAPTPGGALLRSAWQGNETEAEAAIDAAERAAADRGEGLGASAASLARAVLLNGLGRHDEALAAATRAAEHPGDLWVAGQALVELVDAAVHCQRQDRAEEALRLLVVRTGASGTDWALGIEARSRALLADGPEAEGLHRESISRLARTPLRAELARTHLALGEWLRRRRRRSDARVELRAAHDLFTAMGMDAFAGRAARELAATGETARRRDDVARYDLTVREAEIAHLAAEGLSNPEIATRLFLSTRTVEYHLRKVFTKLDIRSRVQLSAALALESAAPHR